MLHPGWFQLNSMPPGSRLLLPELSNCCAGELEIGQTSDPRLAMKAVAQSGGENIDQRAIAAMTIHHHDAPETMRNHARDYVLDQGREGFSLECDGAGKAHMVRRIAIPGRG